MGMVGGVKAFYAVLLALVLGVGCGRLHLKGCYLLSAIDKRQSDILFW